MADIHKDKNVTSSREEEEPRRDRILFNRAVLRLSPQEAREWPNQSVSSGQGGEMNPHERLQALLQEELAKTELQRNDVLQFLSHDTSSTRRQLIHALRLRIAVIEADIAISPDTPLITR